MANTKQATILTPEKLYIIRQPLPRSWLDAAGILKGKKRVNPLAYQRAIRREWDKRFKKLLRSFSL